MSVEGTPAEVEATAAQLQAIYEHAPDAVLTGSMGRAAMYADYGYAAVPPLPLRADCRPVSNYRDLDFMFMPPDIFGGSETADLWHPHILDFGVGRYVQRRGDGGCNLMAEVEAGVLAPIPADPAVIRPVTRKFLGVSVLTLTVGSQLQVERLMPVPYNMDKRQKYQASKAAFAAFADSIRDSHPDEFLPDELYTPFDRVAALRISYHF